jgi:Domain of unknown function (DUF6894)
MKRFFFDVSFKTHVRYDYQGRDFAGPEQARELAELIALDIGCSDNSDDSGTEVQVRNIDGTCLFSIPIRQAEPIAA